MHRLKIFWIAFGVSFVLGISALVLWNWKIKTSDVPTVADSSSSSATTVSSQTSSVTSSKASLFNSRYKAFTPEILRTGTSAVLFFASATDPFSQQDEKLILALAASGALKTNVYRVDYESEPDIRFDFAVVIPDTFIRITAQGQRSESLIHPKPAELKAFLR